jgi:hypothetical protein
MSVRYGVAIGLMSLAIDLNAASRAASAQSSDGFGSFDTMNCADGSATGLFWQRQDCGRETPVNHRQSRSGDILANPESSRLGRDLREEESFDNRIIICRHYWEACERIQQLVNEFGDSAVRPVRASRRCVAAHAREAHSKIGRHTLPNDISLERNDYICNDDGYAHAAALTRCQIRSAFV